MEFIYSLLLLRSSAIQAVVPSHDFRLSLEVFVSFKEQADSFPWDLLIKNLNTRAENNEF